MTFLYWEPIKQVFRQTGPSVLTSGERTDRDCDSHFTPRKAQPRRIQERAQGHTGKPGSVPEARPPAGECNMSEPLFPELRLAPLPASAHRHCLPCPDSDELSPVLSVRSASPPGHWTPAPFKDFAPVITLCLSYIKFPFSA